MTDCNLNRFWKWRWNLKVFQTMFQVFIFKLFIIFYNPSCNIGQMYRRLDYIDYLNLNCRS